MLKDASFMDLVRAGFWLAFGWCIFCVVAWMLMVSVAITFGFGLPALLR